MPWNVGNLFVKVDLEQKLYDLWITNLSCLAKLVGQQEFPATEVMMINHSENSYLGLGLITFSRWKNKQVSHVYDSLFWYPAQAITKIILNIQFYTIITLRIFLCKFDNSQKQWRI